MTIDIQARTGRENLDLPSFIKEIEPIVNILPIQKIPHPDRFTVNFSKRLIKKLY